MNLTVNQKKVNAMQGLKALGDFIALDFETTGISPESDTIIEIGAICYRAGEEVARFETLVNPARNLSGEIEQLTGIRNKDLQGQPLLHEVREDFRAFLGNYPIMAHNAGFELSFLQHTFGKDFTRPMLDTFELLTLTYPLAPSHSLEYFIRSFGLRDYELHRGLQDTLDMVEIVRHVDAALDAPEFAPLSGIVRFWLGESSVVNVTQGGARNFWGWLPFFAGRHPEADVPAYRNYRDMYSGLSRSTLPEALNDAPTRLGEAEFFSKVFDSYQLREAQQHLAVRAADTLREGGLYAVEAGTGTGKTLAYTTAAVAALCKDKSTPIVISTHTKMLQNQFLEQDLPRLKRLFGTKELRAVLLKGMNNYTCLRKLNELQPMQERLFDHDISAMFAAAFTEFWLHTTTEGELNEIPRSLQGNPFILRIVREGRALSRDCTRQHCSFYENCFYFKKRWEAEAAHILTVNHSLLLSYPQSYPDFNRLIVDEADELYREAVEAFSIQISHAALYDQLKALLAPDALTHRILLDITKRLPQGERRDTVLKQAKDLPDLFQRLSKNLNELHALIRSHKKDDIFTLQFTLREQWLKDEQRQAICTCLENLNLALSDALRTGALILSEWKKLAKDEENDDDLPLLTELQYRLEETGVAQAATATFLEDDIRKYALYFRVEELDWQLVVSPFNIGELFATRILERLHGGVFTSATISAREDMRDFSEQCGLELSNKKLCSERFASPFDYRNHSLVLFLKGFPSHNNPEFPGKAAELAAQIALMLNGRLMVLFTSKDRLRRTHEELLPLLGSYGIEVISHGVTNLSIGRCVEQFNNARKAVLLGARGMWKGVDIPGEALQCVMIDKMPYAVPSPYTKGLQNNLMEQYRNKALDAGEEPDERRLRGIAWNTTDKPQMFQAFRQMFGRLIRGDTDRGVMIVLDPQLQGAYLSPRHKELMNLLPGVPHKLVFPDNALRELEFLLPEF